MHEVQAPNNLGQRGFRFSILHMLNILGVNTSIISIYERVLYGYFTYLKDWCSIHYD